jgi:aryl-alcohol dehydrogenase-like predicted oxidoreductase
MGFGVLSGKFLTGESHPKALSLFPQYSRYSSEQSLKATKLYNEIAIKWFDSNRVSACFYRAATFLTSTIIGATTLEQLKKTLTQLM